MSSPLDSGIGVSEYGFPAGSNGSGSSKQGISSMLGPGLGGIADIIGGISDFGQQSAQDAAMTQTGDQLQKDLGALTGEGSNLYGNYAANAQPALNNIIGSNPAAIKGYQGAAASGYGSEAGYGSQLGVSPYPGQIQSEGGLFTSLPSGSIESELSNASALENWHGLQPKELGEATTVASDAADSAARTMKAQMGGVANPGAAFEEGLNTAAQAGMQTGAQLGSMAQQQELGAKEAAGQEYGAVAGQELQEAAGTVGATEAAGSQYATDLSGAGALAGNAASGMAGLSEQDIQELESALSQEGSMAQAGLGAQEYGASDWTSLLEQEMGNAQNQSNPFSGIASGLTSLLPLFGIAA